MSSKSLLSIVLFLCINGVLSSKHKHHNKHSKAVEEDYSSPLADDEQFADKEFLPKGFLPTSVNKHGIVPTFGVEGCCPCAEGLLPTQEAGSDNVLPTPEAGSSGALPTPEAGSSGALPTPEAESAAGSISSDCCPCQPNKFDVSAVLPTFDGAGDDNVLPTFEGQALPTDVLPTTGADGLFPSLENKNMNVNVNHHNNSSNGFLTKLIIFSVIGVVIAGLYLFYRKYYNNNKYISLSQTRDEEAQYQQFVAVQPAEETTPLIV